MINILGLKLYTEKDISKYKKQLVRSIDNRLKMEQEFKELSNEFKAGLKWAYYSSCETIIREEMYIDDFKKW